MCNCGKKRNGHVTEQSSKVDSNQANQPQNKVWEDIYFEYTGNTALSVKGGISGKTYRFVFPGDIQPIDYRDASGMQGIPILKKVRKEKIY